MEPNEALAPSDNTRYSFLSDKAVAVRTVNRKKIVNICPLKETWCLHKVFVTLIQQGRGSL